jgi:glycosyltransferase involved in cell wall biosynthesis
VKITVCIPTFNQAAFLGKAVRSALEQQGVTVEVWVADDASTDDTPSVMQAFASDPRVHYFRQPENLGIAANAGWVISQAETEFIVRLDSDDELEPDYCLHLTELLQSHPKAGVAHCAVQEIDHRNQKHRTRRLARKSGFEPAEQALRGTLHGYRVAANICMLRREAIQSVNIVYRTGMNFCEDWDLYARLAANGWGNVYSSRVLAKYRVWTDTAGYRSGRKAVELEGLIQLFDETLTPAWEKRGWDPQELSAARRSLARSHSYCLQRIPQQSTDYTRVCERLISLAENNEMIGSLSSRQEFSKATWVHDFQRRFRLLCTDWVKAIFYR